MAGWEILILESLLPTREEYAKNFKFNVMTGFENIGGTEGGTVAQNEPVLFSFLRNFVHKTMPKLCARKNKKNLSRLLKNYNEVSSKREKRHLFAIRRSYKQILTLTNLLYSLPNNNTSWKQLEIKNRSSVKTN